MNVSSEQGDPSERSLPVEFSHVLFSTKNSRTQSQIIHVMYASLPLMILKSNPVANLHFTAKIISKIYKAMLY